MRLLFLGDVVGRSGRRAVLDELPCLRARYKLDFVAINGENAAGGFGITEAILEELLGAGAESPFPPASLSALWHAGGAPNWPDPLSELAHNAISDKEDQLARTLVPTASTGAMRIENVIAPSSAKATVQAMGRNKRPSTRCSVKIGM